MGHKGRVTAEFLMKCIPELPTRLVYICGPNAMMAMTIQVLKDLGVPAEQIKSEEFVAAKRVELAEPGMSDDVPVAARNTGGGQWRGTCVDVQPLGKIGRAYAGQIAAGNRRGRWREYRLRMPLWHLRPL